LNAAKSLIETGNEVELVARRLFPNGELVENRGERGQEESQILMAKQKEAIFQPIFVKDGFLAIIDMLKFNQETTSYSVYEVKSNSSIDVNVHYHELAFQINLLRQSGLKINNAYLVHLNPDYIRMGELDISLLFKIVEVTSEVESVASSVSAEMTEALKYLSVESEPLGFCSCIYKGRSKHCSTFQFSNPKIPEYGVHDIARIGNSKGKLKELVEREIFDLDKIPSHIKLTEIQQGQVDTFVQNKVVVQKEQIVAELGTLTFPLYFLDYETFPAAIPRFKGYSPHTHIPFQYSINLLKSAENEPEHLEFLHVGTDDPSKPLSDSLQEHIGGVGSILVWHKSFERGRNDEIATRIPETKSFMDSLNDRIYDLEDIFKRQFYIHRDFRGKTSIKNILPVLVPELSYKGLEIQDGGSAAETWNKITNGSLTETARERAINNLKIYCGLDTYAMYSIWRVLQKS
jgi:hypothetical protein